MKDDRDPPICQDCKHYLSDYNGCDHPALVRFDPVSGYREAYAPSERAWGRDHKCGFHVKLFEPWPPRTTGQKTWPWAVLGGVLLLLGSCAYLAAL